MAAIAAAAAFYVLKKFRTKEQRLSLATKMGLGSTFRRLSSVSIRKGPASSPDGEPSIVGVSAVA